MRASTWGSSTCLLISTAVVPTFWTPRCQACAGYFATDTLKPPFQQLGKGGRSHSWSVMWKEVREAVAFPGITAIRRNAGPPDRLIVCRPDLLRLCPHYCPHRSLPHSMPGSNSHKAAGRAPGDLCRLSGGVQTHCAIGFCLFNSRVCHPFT